MKKVLLASTVLAMTATVAAADVTVSGSARMGVAYNSEAPNELGFTSRVRVAFGLSGETDTGLAFGASIRADNAGNGNNGVTRTVARAPGTGTGNGDVNGAGNQAAGSVFVSGAFGKLSMGDVDGAAELVTGDLAGVGLTGLGDLNESAFLSNSDSNRRSAARYEYSTAGLTFAVSADNPQNDAAALENVYSIGVKYSVDAYAVGLGYETSDVNGVSVDHIIASGEATFSGVTLKAVYGKADDFAGIAGNDLTQYGISAKYSMDALTVTGFHRIAEIGTVKDKYTGIGASYALGGGASVVGGLVDVNYGAAGSVDQTRADLGLSFSF